MLHRRQPTGSSAAQGCLSHPRVLQNAFGCRGAPRFAWQAAVRSYNTYTTDIHSTRPQGRSSSKRLFCGFRDSLPGESLGSMCVRAAWGWNSLFLNVAHVCMPPLRLCRCLLCMSAHCVWQGRGRRCGRRCRQGRCQAARRCRSSEARCRRTPPLLCSARYFSGPRPSGRALLRRNL